MNGVLISDQRLIDVTADGAVRHAADRGERVYVGTWADGTQVWFAVASAEHARTYAREYGIRRGMGSPMSVRWDRPAPIDMDDCAICGGPREDHGVPNGYYNKHAFKKAAR